MTEVWGEVELFSPAFMLFLNYIMHRIVVRKKSKLVHAKKAKHIAW